MSTLERQAHWQNVYQTKSERAVSWFQERPDISLDLIHATGVDTSVSIIDIGGGASRLADALISEGFKAVAVLDLSEKALATSKARLGSKGTQVQWIVADVTNWQPSQTYPTARSSNALWRNPKVPVQPLPTCSVMARQKCPLCAKSGHSALQQRTSLFDHLVGDGPAV